MVEDEIANLNKNDIINTEGVSKLEQAKKQDHKIYITDIAINKIPLVKVAIFNNEQNKMLQQKHKELLKISKEENNSNEVASVFKIDLSENEVQFGTENTVKLGLNPIICDIITRSIEKTVFVAHNHPSTQNFSYSDFSVILMNTSVLGISVVTNSGEVHILYKTDKYDIKKSYELLTEIKQKYIGSNKITEITDSLISKEFLKRCNESGLYYLKVGGTNGK